MSDTPETASRWDGLSDELEVLVHNTKVEQDRIEYYGMPPSGRNQSAEELTAKFLEFHEVIIAALRSPPELKAENARLRDALERIIGLLRATDGLQRNGFASDSVDIARQALETKP